MREAGHPLAQVLEHLPDLIAVLERDGTIRELAGRVEPVLGAGWRDAVGTNLRDQTHPDDAATVAAFVAGVAAAAPGCEQRAEWRLRAADGHCTVVEAVARSIDDGLVLSARDVRDRKAVEAHLRHRAHHDDLTELPNRRSFHDRLELALAGGAGTDQQVALLVVDLDDFKALNDARGHAAGDALLVEAARRLRSCLRGNDLAARMGGDEFAVLIEDVAGGDEAVQVAQRIAASFTPPVIDTTLRVSIGVAISRPGERSADELLRRADAAMYSAKRHGGCRWELYGPTLEPAGQDHQTALARSGAQRDEVLALLSRPASFQPAFQPIMDLRTGMLVGYEALARFAKPFDRPPNLWIEQAHRCGLGARLEAMLVAAALAVPGRPEGTWLSVNASPSALTSPELQEVLPERLDGIVVEITETEHIPDIAPIREVIAALRARGARLALDDAGSGYSGLQHVVRLAPDVIKLDRSVVDGVHSDLGRAALIEAFVRYAREIDAMVVAEGIETAADLERLADLDVTLGQGWAIAHPGSPWTPVLTEATTVCTTSLSATLAKATSSGGAHLGHDRRLEWLAARLSEATTYPDLVAALKPMLHELHADEVVISEIDREDLVMIGASGPLRFGERYRIADYPATARVLRAQEAVQVLASDPAADPYEVQLMRRGGIASLLMLPVVCGGESIGLFEALSHEDRPWSRFELSRARIICLQVGAALERIQRRADAAALATASLTALVTPPAA